MSESDAPLGQPVLAESEDDISMVSNTPRNSGDELVKRIRLEPEDVDEITMKLTRVINPRLYTVTIRKFQGVATVSWWQAV